MHAKKVLFPTDFSELSDAALGYATTLARDTGARLLIVHVVEPSLAYAGGEGYYPMESPDPAAVRQCLEAVAPPDPSVAYEHRVLHGDPAAEIVTLAEQEGVDMIVMGTHGRTGLVRFIMGSVAEAVVRRASCPVFTLKQPHAAPVGSG